MSGPVIFLSHAVTRARTLVLTTGAVLAAFQVRLIFVARSIQNSGGFKQLGELLSPFVSQLMGPSFTSFMSFSGIVCAGYIELAVIGAPVSVSIGLATTPTAEIESGFADLILSRPMARHWIVTRSIIVTALASVVLLIIMMGGTWGGLEALAPKDAGWPSASLILSLALNMGLLMLCWSGVAMAIGCASKRRSVAGTIAGLLALTTYLLDYVGRLWQPAERVAWPSPFRYYAPFDLVMGSPLSTKNLVVLGGIAAAGFATAYVAFARRDISH
jgi:ABC-2 type transport system permease protein